MTKLFSTSGYLLKFDKEMFKLLTVFTVQQLDTGQMPLRGHYHIEGKSSIHKANLL
jgi:hypothetical protein